MGMFDEVYFEKPIQCPCGHDIEFFQTKDFDQVLDQFIVKENGLIEMEDYKLHETDDKNSFGLNHFRKELLGYKTLDVTQKVNCYTVCPSGKHWIEVDITFINGKSNEQTIKFQDYE